MKVRLQLDRRLTDLLRSEPESGMGYQRVDVRFSDGRHLEDVLVFNAAQLEVPDAFKGAEVEELKIHSSPARKT